MDKLITLKESKEVGLHASLELKNMTPNDQSKFLVETNEFYDKFTNYIQQKINDNEIQNQIQLFSPFCLLQNTTPRLIDFKNVFHHFNLQDVVDYDKLTEEVLNLNSHHKSIMNLPSYLNAKTSAERWEILLKKQNFSAINIILSYIFTASSTSCFVERIFSIVNNKWDAERNRLSCEVLAAEVKTCVNFDMTPVEFAKFIKGKSELLNQILNSDKYM